MKTFADNAGRTWTVALNVDALKRVRSLCDVDLMQIVSDGGKLLDRLMADPVLLCDVIFALCKEEAETKGISDTDFGKAMAGDPIEHATQALLEELVDFFPNRTQREVLGKTPTRSNLRSSSRMNRSMGLLVLSRLRRRRGDS